MPTADQFKTRGLGNGFPFCFEKVNVTDNGESTPFDYWTTLGGTNKDNVAGLTAVQKAANINKSAQNAAKLYWTLYSVTSSGDFDGTPLTDTINADDNLVGGFAEPKNRQKKDSFNRYGLALDSQGPSELGTYLTAMFNSNSSNIVKIYNGDTSQESNFVGYGIFSDVKTAFDFPIASTPGIEYALSNGGSSRLTVYLCAYGDGVTEIPGETAYDFAYITLEGISFLCAVKAEVEGGGGIVNVDAENRTANLDNGVDNLTITLDSIEFYTEFI